MRLRRAPCRRGDDPTIASAADRAMQPERAVTESRRRCDRPPDLLLVDRQIDESGDNAERNRQIPYDVVAAGRVVQQTAEPRAENAADLVREERKSREHCKEADAEDLRDDSVRRRNGGQP